MVLQLNKQYPFNFVSFAFEVLGKPINDRALAKFDACEVHEFLQSRGMIEKNALEYILMDEKDRKSMSPKVYEDYKQALGRTVVEFERAFLNGNFSLVSLSDYDNLAMSWIDAQKLKRKIERLSSRADAKRCLQSIEEKLTCFLLNAKCYRARNLLAKNPEIEEKSVLGFHMDSEGRQILIDDGLDTVGDLIRVTADYLLSLDRFGEKRLEAVRDNLAELGVHLLGEG